ncbi:MAG TPA: hypothetical protein VMH31_09605 [Methylomirabilota bacterium]|nr:hypothetical protein [Methylomirabilota bacterium]
MKAAVAMVLSFVLVCVSAPPSSAEPRQLPSGTEMHLTLVTPINTATIKDGDAILAVTTQPVAVDSRIILPAGTRLRGVVGTVKKAKYFSSFKGQAYVNITFKTIEVDSRLIPVQMSLEAVGRPRTGNGSSPIRKDVKIMEGEVVQQKHDYKEDAIALAVGGGGGSTIGLIAGSLGKGMGIGFAVGAAYVVAHKGKEVNLPENTAMLVRLDNAITVPYVAASNETSGVTEVASAK